MYQIDGSRATGVDCASIMSSVRFPTQQPCALIFTLGPGGERARRPLLPSGLEDDELALRTECLLSAVDASFTAGCRVMVSCPEDARLPVELPRLPQEGTGF